MNKCFDKLNINNLDNDEPSIIIGILLFCDDATTVYNCPILLQKLIDMQLKALKWRGMSVHPDESKLIMVGERFLSKEQLEFKIRLDFGDGNIMILKNNSKEKAKLLGVCTSCNSDKVLDFEIHIEYLRV